MRITCPECDAVLSLGQPKAGTYHPRCKQCGRKFRLDVSGEEPPALTIQRLPPQSEPHAAPQRSGENRGAAIAERDVASRTLAAQATVAQTRHDRGNDRELAEVADPLPTVMAGYRILRLLGRGAMGTVYEAKQVSLDRVVALKMIRGRLSENASSLARFMREAYAAAQLAHPNVVQIYDFGEHEGKHFFSMEWVRGGPLSELVRQKGMLDPRLAAGYILQAARGLRFAHRHGMVHRDVKPANLLLTEDGVVKVADLGLVKIPDQVDVEDRSARQGSGSVSGGLISGTEVTMQGTAVGTPAYMAPEQGRDSAAVDHRVDIYSLGCCLFFLLTGKPPFEDSDAARVMERHASETIPDPRQLNPRVPAELDAIVRQAAAKDPDDRYYTLTEMIEDLESFLGMDAEGRFSPTKEQAERWEELAARFAAATRVQRLVAPLPLALIAAAMVLTLLILLTAPAWALTGIGVLCTAVAVGLGLGASEHDSPLVESLRRWIGTFTMFDWVVAAVGGIAFVLVTIATGTLVGLVLGCLFGAGLGFLYHFGIVVPVREAAAPVIADARRYLRELRTTGADEEGLRLFAARYSGPHWQSLFESLFGYEALRRIRWQLRSDPSMGPTIEGATIRDRLCSWLRGKTVLNAATRDHWRLAAIEQRGLRSEGLSEKEARDRAWQIAHALIESVKSPPRQSRRADEAAEAKRTRIKAMLADARSGRYARERQPFAVARFALGGQTRLLAGCLLLILFAIWTQQTGLLGQVTSIAESAATDGSIDPEAVDRLAESAITVNTDAGGKWSIGIAGLLLAISSFVSGWRMTVAAAPATLVILFGPQLGIPGVGERIDPWMVAAVIGILIYIPGYIFGETEADRYW